MRCLVPADGFYEWEATPSGKQPWFIRMKAGGLLAFAGLWEHWQAPDGTPLETATLITTDANALMRPVHDHLESLLPDYLLNTLICQFVVLCAAIVHELSGSHDPAPLNLEFNN